MCLCRCRRAARPSSCCPAMVPPPPASSTRTCRPATPSSRSSTLCCPRQHPAAQLHPPLLLQQVADRPHHPHKTTLMQRARQSCCCSVCSCCSSAPLAAGGQKTALQIVNRMRIGSGSAGLSGQQLLMLRCLGPLSTRPAVASACRWIYSRHVTALSGFRPYNCKRDVKPITTDTGQDVGNRRSACTPYSRGEVTL